MSKYKDKLETEDNVGLVLPLCHLYEPQDERTAREFDFPQILSGHGHHGTYCAATAADCAWAPSIAAEVPALVLRCVDCC